MQTLLRKLSFAAVGVGIMALAASTGLSGQAPAGQAPARGGGGGRRGGGAAAGAPQAPGAPATPAAPAQGAGRGPATPPQGGRGPVKVLIITRGHQFERQAFFEMFDALGEDITWTHVEHPAADVMMSPQYAKAYDVLAFYDLGGPGVSMAPPRGGGPAPVPPPGAAVTANNRFYPQPSPDLKKNFEALVKEGKGLVFLHHASAAWAHVWPEYSEVIGGACDWYAPTTVRGIDDPNMGYFGMTPQHITFTDKLHPITQGLSDFDVVDEAYVCHWFPDSFHTLAITDFKPADPTKNLNARVPYSNATAWVKAAENSPVFFTQVGHGSTSWAVPGYRALLRNAFKWIGSKEALDWAKTHPQKIWK
jgi:type 1 glutamine amidotransferase